MICRYRLESVYNWGETKATEPPSEGLATIFPFMEKETESPEEKWCLFFKQENNHTAARAKIKELLSSPFWFCLVKIDM